MRIWDLNDPATAPKFVSSNFYKAKLSNSSSTSFSRFDSINSRLSNYALSSRNKLFEADTDSKSKAVKIACGVVAAVLLILIMVVTGFVLGFFWNTIGIGIK